MTKRLYTLIATAILAFSCVGCGGADPADVPADEPKQEAPTDVVNEEDTPLEEDLTADLKEWFEILYGDEGGPSWYPDVTDLRIVTANDRTSLQIESANTDESVAQATAMLIWGYNDTLIEDVYVFSQDGAILFEKHK